MEWFRWHVGAVTDPKFRVVASRAGLTVSDIIAVFAAFLERGSQSKPRGNIAGWQADDIGITLDMPAQDVIRIHSAMQGKLLDGDVITGWNRRNPQREDDSAQRTRQWRERNVTQRDASVTQRDDREKEREREKKDSISIPSESHPSTDGLLTAFEAYNQLAKNLGLPVAAKLTASRRQKLKQRIGDAGGLSGWHKALENLAASAMLRGENDRGWRADFDFLLQAKSFMRLFEGGYGNGRHGNEALARQESLDDLRARLGRPKTRQINTELDEELPL